MASDAQPVPEIAEPKARIFISYSRKDMAFADRLEAALRARGFEPLIDRTEIYAFEDWWKRIEGLIGRADTVVFVLSPDAVASEVALKEVAHATSLNKRFAPIVCRRTDDGAVPEALRRLNFVFFDDPSRFEASADQLAGALNTDIGWVRQHTEYGEEARRWAAGGRKSGLLLRSPVLEEAERWIASRSRDAPEPTAETQAFVAESRRGASRRRNILTGSLTAGLIVAFVLAGLAFWQRQRAEQQTKIALANEAHAKNQEAIASNSFKLGVFSDRRVAYRFAREKDFDQAFKELDRLEQMVRNYLGAKPNDPYWLDQIAAIENQYGEILTTKGDFGAALGRFRQSREILLKLIKNEPGNSEFRADLLEARQQLADALAALHRPREGLDELLAARKAEAALPPDTTHNSRLQNEVVSIDLDLGDKLLAASRNKEAQVAFVDARARLIGMKAESSKDVTQVGNLAHSERGVGDALFVMRKFSEAASTYADAIKTIRIVASLDADGMTNESDELNVDHRIGQSWIALGMPDKALTAYGDALATLADASKKWPRNKTGWSQTFVFIKTTIGAILKNQDKLPDALAADQQARDRQKELVSAAPTDLTEQGRLVGIDQEIGGILQRLGRLDDALASENEALDAQKAVLAAAPDNQDAQMNLGYSYARIGSVLLDQKQYDQAISNIRHAIDLYRSVLKTSLNNKQARNSEFATLESWGDILASEGKGDEALSVYRDALASGTKLIAIDPADTGNLRDVAVLDTKVARLLSKKSDNDGAATWYQAALDLLERFIPQHPEDMAGRAALAWTYGQIGEVYWAQSKLVDSSGALKKAVLAEQAALSYDAATARSWPWLEYFPRDLGHIAFKLELIKLFQPALEDADLALSIVPNDISIAANRAHALMFLGRTDEARAIYLAHRGEQVGEGSWEKMLLDDFGALRKAGLDNPLMEEMQMTFAVKP